MNRVGQFAITLLIISLFILPTLNSTNSQNIETTNLEPSKKEETIENKGPAYRYNIQGWIHLHIEGKPFERGYQYGYLLSEEIADSFERWNEFIIQKHEDVNFIGKRIRKIRDVNLWELYKKHTSRLFLKKLPEEYHQELKGMTKGLQDKETEIFGRDVEFKDVVTLQFIQDTLYTFHQYPHKQFHLITYIGSKLCNLFNPLVSTSLSIAQAIRRFYSNRLLSPREDPLHCSAFIATGEYTKDGGIVIAHSTIFKHIIAERCNLILNVKPSEGNSFTMTTFPGSIWSQEDWYQNEKGIVLTETELPQGPFNRKKTPKGIRSRTAIQYSDSIDDCITILQNENNGLIPNEWLIGDTKTGEIASLEQAYWNTPIKRTSSGFYWSCNIPHNEKVQNELYGIVSISESWMQDLNDLIGMKRDVKFEEIKNKYKGEIDEESAKKILATYPICRHVTDGKITTSNMMKNNGLQVYLGNPNGTKKVISSEGKEKYRLITDQPAVGWLEIYPSDRKNSINKNFKNHLKENGKTTNVKWKYTGNSNKAFQYASIKQNDKEVFATSSDGDLMVLSKEDGAELWSCNVGNKNFEIKVVDDKVYVGSDNGLTALDKDIHTVEWKSLDNERIHSISNVKNGFIFAGSKHGKLYAVNANSGMVDWSHKFENPVYVSKITDGKLYFTSGKKCYSANMNGEITWDFEADKVITSSPVYNDGKVFFGSWDNNLYCLDKDDGSEIWSFKTEWSIDSTPEFTKNQVFIGSLDNNFYALDKKTGELNWVFECKSAIHTNPVAYGEYVFFGSDDGRVYALDKKTGENIWTYAPEYKLDDSVNNYITTPILSDIIVDDGVLYFGVNNNIYALDAQTFEKEKEEKEEFISEQILLILFVLLAIVGASLLIWGYYLKNKKQK